MDTIELNVKEIRWLNKSEKPFEPTLEKLWSSRHTNTKLTEVNL